MIRTSVAALAVLLASTSLTPSAMAQTTSAAAPAVPAGGFATSAETDPYLWLEEVEGERAMEWVKAHNERTFAVLQGDPRYETLHQQALEIVQAQDRIPSPGFTHTAISTTSGRTPSTYAGCGVARRWTAIAPRRRSGRPFWTSTPWRRPRAPTGSTRARPASSPKNATA